MAIDLALFPIGSPMSHATSDFDFKTDEDKSPRVLTPVSPKQARRKVNKPWRCPVATCGREFKRGDSWSINRHEMKHWPRWKLPYACDFPGCDTRAAQKGTLETHKRTHKPKENRLCCTWYTADGKDCPYTYIDPSRYTSHKQKHHGVPKRGDRTTLTAFTSLSSKNKITKEIFDEIRADKQLYSGHGTYQGYGGYYTFPPVAREPDRSKRPRREARAERPPTLSIPSDSEDEDEDED